MLQQKIDKLKEYIKEQKRILIAFSGGVDSTLLAYLGNELLGENCIALTVLSDFISEEEKESALHTAKELGLNHKIISVDIFKQSDVLQNRPDRCYQCKKVIFEEILRYSKENNIHCIFEGSNADDRDDYRPGHKALKEMDIQSPLDFFNFSKDEIRQTAKNLGISVWHKPSSPCLATRIPYDTAITREALTIIEKGEKILKDHGFTQFRLRLHGNIGRIELIENEMKLLLEKDLKSVITEKLSDLGISYITLDLKGYRTGSMNETLKDTENG